MGLSRQALRSESRGNYRPPDHSLEAKAKANAVLGRISMQPSILSVPCIYDDMECGRISKVVAPLLDSSVCCSPLHQWREQRQASMM
jgi:hypothetical protein